MTSASATISQTVTPTGRRCSLCGLAKDLCAAPLLPDFLWHLSSSARATGLSLTRADRARDDGPAPASCCATRGACLPRPEALLCCHCQRKLGDWDRDAQQALACASVSHAHPQARALTVDGLDYARFKLFQLSVLWRAGISRDPLFRSVKLGPHEGKLRRMLLSDDPGPADSYPVTLFIRRVHSVEPAPITRLNAPVSSTIGGRRCYRFSFGLLDWVFTVSSEPLPELVQREALQLSGRMALLLGPIPTDTPPTQRSARWAPRDTRRGIGDTITRQGIGDAPARLNNGAPLHPGARDEIDSTFPSA